MSTVWVRNGLRLGVLLAAGVALVTAPALAKPRPGSARRIMNLFAGILDRQNANQFDCGLNAFGEVCVDPNGSTTVGGGFWPKGTPDQYVFNSGIQVAGIIPSGIAGFSWSGDTSGAMFFNASVVGNGDKLSLVWSSLRASDLANWPRDAYVPNDPSLFDPLLIGRKSASQQDTWIQYWDGNPANNSQRKHPLGILVTQRGMAWNFPTGNESVIYFFYTFTNVTASKKSVYDAVDPLHSDTLASLGARFAQLNAGAGIPDTGYTIQQMYAAFSMDCDVTDEATKNYSSIFFPLQLGYCYKSTFYESPASGYKFLPPIFSAPFAQTVGFVGVKYLKSPLRNPAFPDSGQVGLTLYSTFVNPNNGSFTDPANMEQLWRYLSAHLNPAAGDPGCSAPNPLLTHFCFLTPVPVDVRFFQSSGPLTLKPGASQTIVVAYLTAPPVDGTWIAARGPSFDLYSGLPALDTALAAGHDTLRSVDHALGAVSFADKNGDGHITQDEVTTVPRSLLNRGTVAQAVFDAKFLLPFPPDPPDFFLVPGDNQVSVVWRPSATEQTGDPYYAVASNPTSKLYDANYRRFDVEGYRIYRGRTSGDLQLVAQFDYAGTEFQDYTGAFNYGNCAPEVGVTTDCPAKVLANYDLIADTLYRPVVVNSFAPQPLVGDIVQIPPGGRVKLANGNILIVQADTAVTSGGGATCNASHSCLKLSDTGVPFAFVDKGVRNSFRYFYAVTAFDVNSVASVGPGATSLESAPATKTVTPRAASSATTQTVFTVKLHGDDTTTLNPNALYPKIDTATGTFNGNMPPANGGLLAVPSAVTEFLKPGDVNVAIDSMSGGIVDYGPTPIVYLTFSAAGGDTVHLAVPVSFPDRTTDPNKAVTFSEAPAVMAYDVPRAGAFGVRTGFADSARMPVNFTGTMTTVNDKSDAVAEGFLRYGAGGGSLATAYLAHSRWFTEGGSEPPDPTIMAAADSAHNSGKLTGVGRIYAPQSYREAFIDQGFRGFSFAQTNWYAADFTVTWNLDSSVTVRDLTHHITLPFAPNGGSGWGFVNVRAFLAAGVTVLNLSDAVGAVDVNVVGYHHLYGTFPTCTPNWWGPMPCVSLERKAQYEPLDFNADGVSDASGIAIIVNDEAFLMEMNGIPATGTKWHLRAVSGVMTATCTPSLGEVMTDCRAYTFKGPAIRPTVVPGLNYTLHVATQYTVDSTSSGNLANIHTVPDPYYVTNALEQSTNDKILKFVNLPNRCIVRIYSLSGVLVNVLTLNDPTGGGELTWNLRNRNNQFVASGVYFYHVETPEGKQRIGRFTVVNFAQ